MPPTQFTEKLSLCFLMGLIDSLLSYWTNHLLNLERLRGLTTSRLNYIEANPLSPDCPASRLIFYHRLIVQSCSDSLEGVLFVIKCVVREGQGCLAGFRGGWPGYKPKLCC